jgi:pantetheine-phosphate adenylyltransferase
VTPGRFELPTRSLGNCCSIHLSYGATATYFNLLRPLLFRWALLLVLFTRYNAFGVNTVKAIYPGSFDPVTNGHLDLIARGTKIFDHLVVAILRNSGKNPLFSVEERVEMLSQALSGFQNVSVATFDGLLVDFVREQHAQAVMRGIRAISDYEYELQMALMNRRLAPDLETVFLMPDGKYSFVSSRLVKEVFTLGGSIEGLVPQFVIERLKARVPNGH